MPKRRPLSAAVRLARTLGPADGVDCPGAGGSRAGSEHLGKQAELDAGVRSDGLTNRRS